MDSFKIPLGPGIDEPHIVDEVATTDSKFVTNCDEQFERNRRIQAQEVDSLDAVDEDVCSDCKQHL